MRNVCFVKDMELSYELDFLGDDFCSVLVCPVFCSSSQNCTPVNDIRQKKQEHASHPCWHHKPFLGAMFFVSSAIERMGLKSVHTGWMDAISRRVPNVVTFIDRCFHSNMRALSVCSPYKLSELATRNGPGFMISVPLKSLLFSQHIPVEIYDSRWMAFANIVRPFCMTIK